MNTRNTQVVDLLERTQKAIAANGNAGTEVLYIDAKGRLTIPGAMLHALGIHLNVTTSHTLAGEDRLIFLMAKFAIEEVMHAAGMHGGIFSINIANDKMVDALLDRALAHWQSSQETRERIAECAAYVALTQRKREAMSA